MVKYRWRRRKGKLERRGGEKEKGEGEKQEGELKEGDDKGKEKKETKKLKAKKLPYKTPGSNLNGEHKRACMERGMHRGIQVAAQGGSGKGGI